MSNSQYFSQQIHETHFNADIAPTKNTGSLFDKVCRLVAPLIVEFIGTLLLVLTIELATSPQKGSSPVNPPLTIGFGLMVFVFWGGSISGGHYNPAVTFGVLLTMRSKVEILMSILYVIAQVAGSFAGAFIGYAINGQLGPGPTVGDGYGWGSAFTIEFIWTVVLVSVVLNVATTKAHSNNSFYGLAIGGTVFVGASIAGGISGAAFNPAVGTGPKIVHYIFANASATTFDKNIWIYWVAPMLASIMAALFFRVTNVGEYSEESRLSINDSEETNNLL